MALDPWSYAEKYKNEHAHQTALFMWANVACRFGLTAANMQEAYTVKGEALKQLHYNSDAIPQLKWLHAIHNQGHGDAIRGGKAKAEGVKAGVFDMFLPVPINTQQIAHGQRLYHGLYLELKVGKNTMSPVQAEFAADMTRNGYACECAWGWMEARDKILNYLGIGC